MKIKFRRLTTLTLLSSLLLGGICPALAGGAVERVEVSISSKEEVDIADKEKELENLGFFPEIARGTPLDGVKVAVVDRNEESGGLEFSSLAEGQGYEDGEKIYKNVSDPKLPDGKYKEFRINRGTPNGDGKFSWKNDGERLVIDKKTKEVYYTPDHYHHFMRLE